VAQLRYRYDDDDDDDDDDEFWTYIYWSRVRLCP
jgi:hypothetical protein